jgi:phosphoribosyl-ATP pyrophosphohydrolase
VVTDERGIALGLAWSSRESLRQAVATRRGIYQSRRRGIWTKGESSGATQELVRVAVDCDRDTLRFTVRQHARGFCHRDQATCWDDGSPLDTLARTVQARVDEPVAGSYTSRLLSDPALLEAKLIEEAIELARAKDRDDTVREAADLWYFAAVRLVQAGGRMADVERELCRRALRITRRPGGAKCWVGNIAGGPK